MRLVRSSHPGKDRSEKLGASLLIRALLTSLSACSNILCQRLNLITPAAMSPIARIWVAATQLPDCPAYDNPNAMTLTTNPATGKLFTLDRLEFCASIRLSSLYQFTH